MSGERLVVASRRVQHKRTAGVCSFKCASLMMWYTPRARIASRFARVVASRTSVSIRMPRICASGSRCLSGGSSCKSCGSSSRICTVREHSQPRRARRFGVDKRAHVDVKLFAATQGQEKLHEQVDAAVVGDRVVGRGDQARVAGLLKGGIPATLQGRQPGALPRTQRSWTHLIVDATPPRRIVEGCSVKEMILASGGSAFRSGVERRKARPAGSCSSET